MTEREIVYRRTIRVLLLSQLLAGAGLAAGITVGALLAEDMLGSTGSAGLPAALFTLGSAGAAVGVGRLSQRSGRRPGLAVGYAVGALGGGGVVLAAAVDSVPLLFLALVLYGSGVATTLGAVVGPNLVEPTGALAEAIGVRELAGPFILATAAYALAAVAVTLLLRPDPLLSARAWADDEPAATLDTGAPAQVAAVRLAAATMVVTQLVMVAVMTMTPVHMRDHGHDLGAAGLVISIHVAAMFLPSPLTGVLVDRFGRRPIALAGLVTLVAAGLLAAAAPHDSVVLLAVALGLLGLGWNFGLVSGTAMVTDAVPLAQRAKTQGSVDLTIALAGATGGMTSGFVVAATSYAVLSLAGGVLALALTPALLTARKLVTGEQPSL